MMVHQYLADNGNMLGEILVKEGLITQEQLQHVLELQKSDKLYLPLGELCVSRGLIGRMDLQQVLRKHRKSIPLGELLVNMGLISREQLQEALARQKKKGGKIGEILLEMEAIDETGFVNALSLQLGIPKIIPSVAIIDKKLLNKFNPDFLHQHRIIPAFQEDKRVTLIMANPLDQERIEQLRQLLKCDVFPAVATASEIANAITMYFQKMELGQELQQDESVKDLVIAGAEFSGKKEDNIIEIVNFLISNAIMDRATDIHIEPQDGFLRVRFRVDGVMLHKTDLPNAIAPKLINRIKAICGLDLAEKRRHQDGRIQARVMQKEYDLRVSTYAAIWGENVVIRVQSRQSKYVDINQIGFSPVNLQKFISMLNHPSGIILVTGPTGSGKSTTLYASLQYLNKMDRVIITVEDPVEYTIDGVVQANLPNKMKIRYSDFLKAMMRQDPDVLMIGEIRDPEAAEAVIQASLTGHKVLSTFHTEDATGALLRLMDMGIETFLISSTLVSVVAQRLVRVLCDFCKKKGEPSLKALSFFNSIENPESVRNHFFQPGGCIHCNNTGFRGLTGIHEVLMVNDAIRNAILQRSTSSEIRKVARREAGLITMTEDGFYKALKGVTNLDEIIRVVHRDESKGLQQILVSDLVKRSEVTG
jgi:type IV pilus assembly protein PilB